MEVLERRGLTLLHVALASSPAGFTTDWHVATIQQERFSTGE